MPKLGYPWTFSPFVFILGLLTKDHKFCTPGKPLNSNNKLRDQTTYSECFLFQLHNEKNSLSKGIKK